MVRRDPGEGFWGSVWSKAISGWIVGLAIPASLGLFSVLVYVVMSEWHIQATFPRVEAKVAEHDTKIREIQAQLMTPAMMKRLDDFLEREEKKRGTP